MTTPTVSHAALVSRAVQFLRTAKRCSVVLSEMQCNWFESPDAIGFTKNHSVLIECKVSRNDFSRDARKACRRPGIGMGYYRFYLTPAGLVRPYEVDGWITGEADRSSLSKSGSTGWGLLWWNPQNDKISLQRPSSRFDVNQKAENIFLVSALQRVQLRITEPLHQYIRWATAPPNPNRQEVAVQ